MSADESGPVMLAIDPDHRVRFDKVATPEPASVLGLMMIGSLGGASVLKRKSNKGFHSASSGGGQEP